MGEAGYLRQHLVGDEARVGVLPALRSQHASILPACPLAIATGVQWRENAACKLAGFLQHGLGQLQ